MCVCMRERERERERERACENDRVRESYRDGDRKGVCVRQRDIHTHTERW